MLKNFIQSTQRRIKLTNFIFPISRSSTVKNSSQLISPCCSSSSRFFGRLANTRFDAKFVDLLGLKQNYFFCSDSKSIEKLHRCWNCEKEEANGTPFLFCQACRTVQPIDYSIDYFQIFGMRRNFCIGTEELEKRYKDWQKKLHPDLVHSKSQRERDYASEQSARVTDAFRTLSDALLRAIYIMKLEGVVVDEEERITDLELLAEILELREAVEEAEGFDSLNQIQVQLQKKFQHCCSSFEDALQRKQYEDAISSIRRMTYYKRTNEEIVKKL